MWRVDGWARAKKTTGKAGCGVIGMVVGIGRCGGAEDLCGCGVSRE